MEEDYTIANKQGNDYTIVYIFFTQKKTTKSFMFNICVVFVNVRLAGVNPLSANRRHRQIL